MPENHTIGACPVCGTKNKKYSIPKNGFHIYKCSECGLEHTHPIPSEAQLKEFYSSYTDIRAASDVVLLNAERNLKFLRRFGYNESKFILDFGTGDADFLDVAGEHCMGIDFKPQRHPRCYQSLDALPVKKFDFITLWAVLEHLADPVGTCAEIGKYLNPGAIIAITTVNAEGLIPYHYKPVEHLTYWTRRAFEILFEKTGFELIEYVPYTMMQRAEIYIDRLLSRTPECYRGAFKNVALDLPEYLEVPTNEIFAVGRYVG